jgi:predicted peroxiredoxin
MTLTYKQKLSKSGLCYCVALVQASRNTEVIRYKIMLDTVHLLTKKTKKKTKLRGL